MDNFWNGLSKYKQQCPICEGAKLIAIPIYKHGHELHNVTQMIEECPGCDGKGYIKIER